MTFAEQEFTLGSANDPGSLRSKLLSVERQTGKTPAELEGLVELPEASYLIWSYFIDLNNSRQSGMGVNPISYSEMDAYFRLNDIQVFDFEVKAIKALDNLMIKVHSEKQKQEEQANQNKVKSKK